MVFFHLVAILLSNAVLIQSQSAITNPRVAIAHLNSKTVNGTIAFLEIENGTIHVQGLLIGPGLKPGLYGFHIHEFGNTITCDSTGAHFDPHRRSHGGRLHDVRHVGDFGNVRFEDAGAGIAVAHVDFLDEIITFSGQNNILGRGLVLHEQEDDLGEGGHELSSTTGNAGARIACGVIGIQSGNWNSGISTYSSSSLVIFGILFLFLK
ncbi:superoxide dismutase [Cu-Zn], chloroplastic-like [Maniola jurtina]|uniref:superoxide dismutase [Cu-Zn], chloroplastic-like n=1 Tax=Maniola jurtina TaxID=191418 RepID=UPI001E687DDB|nr:superoxide dismutase [Cu-Zn], chloroplastic-like [Maniola jurtina]